MNTPLEKQRKLLAKARLGVLFLVVILVITAIAIVTAVFATDHVRGIKTTITNKTGAPLSNVAFQLIGGRVSVGTLANGEQKDAYISTKIESGVRVVYTQNGKVTTTESFGFIDHPYYFGKMQFTLHPDGRCTFVDDSHPLF